MAGEAVKYTSMKTNITKWLVISNCTVLAFAGLLLAAAWVGTRFEPSVPALRSEITRFEAMPAQLDWKPTAVSLIKSRQDIVHMGSTGLRVVMGIAFGFAALGAANLFCLHKLARSVDGGTLA